MDTDSKSPTDLKLPIPINVRSKSTLERLMAMDSEQLNRFISKTMAEELSTGCSEEPARVDDGKTTNGDYDMVLAEQRDLARILPDDVLADVFHRLAPRWLAVSRCVRRDWRAAIDARRHLRADLLPLSFHGIFLHFKKHKFPELFARPSSSPAALAISGRLDFLPNTNTSIKVSHPDYYLDWSNYDILHHCNGLLLLSKYVVNPATRCWDLLPRKPRALFKPILRMDNDQGHTYYKNYLVFDPTVSPHYEVFIIPQLYTRNFEDYFDPLVEKPSSPCSMRVFSSRSGQWEVRSFVGEVGAVGTVSSIMLMGLPHFAVYWRGALYVQRGANFVVRLSLSDNKYRVIRPAAGAGVSIHRTRYLDRSKNGVYFAALDKYYRLRVWILDESLDQMEWTLKQDIDLEPVVAPHRQVHGRWKLRDVNYNLYCSHLPKYMKTNIVEEKLEWNPDSDDLDDVETEGYCSGENKKRMKKRKLASIDTDQCELYLESLHYAPKVRILGFHPYREVVFLKSTEKGLAFHLTTSRIEILGNIYPTNYNHFKGSRGVGSNIKYSFIYTPCWFEESPNVDTCRPECV